MTPNEIQALREKHRPVMQLKRPNGNNCCTCGTFDGYPCDTIKVLDELDLVCRELEVSKKGINVLLDAGLAATGAFKELAAQPCNKCGAKQ